MDERRCCRLGNGDSLEEWWDTEMGVTLGKEGRMERKG
jgi:hypothetical protein